MIYFMEQRKIGDFSISTGPYCSFINDIIFLAKSRMSASVCISNVHTFIEAYKDKKFNNIINNAEMVTPDGKPIVWSLRLLYGIKQDRVAGMDLLPDLLNQMMVSNISAYFYGGSALLLQRTQWYLMAKYPLLKMAGMYSPPFRDLTKDEEQEVIDSINNSGANVVFVVLGCPKQEKWMASMKGRINAVMIGVGGALPVMIGIYRRAPKWMQQWGLEWFFRFIQEPLRLFRRYGSTNTLFIFLFIKEYIRLKILHQNRRLFNTGK
ncbi:MAG: glycosyl transferase, WecB/TagA/CpsF family [Segetibacter sp.]|nr:glycosyl transferase, WecB/TagA/CpsF family [Segetibacter sp.]